MAPASEPDVQAVVGEAVALLDVEGADLGSATVLAIETPKTVVDLPADFGNTYVALRVR